MSIVFVAALMSPGFAKFAAHSWLVLMVIISMGYYTYTIINGSAIDYVCSAENIDQYNEDIDQIEDDTGAEIDDVTQEDCRMGGKTGLIIDCCIKWLLSLYFAYAIMQWSQKSADHYHH